jgi:hypothetical protein
MSTDEKRVREFAYQIWESEGRPEGQEARHWEMARKLVEAEGLTPGNPSKTGTTKAAPKVTPKAPAKAKAKPAAAAPVAAPPAEKKAAVKKPRAPRKPAAS